MFRPGKIVIEWDAQGRCNIGLPISTQEHRNDCVIMLAEALKQVVSAQPGKLLLPAPAQMRNNN